MHRTRNSFLVSLAVLPCVAAAAPRALVTNQADNTVSVVDTASNEVVRSIPLGVGYSPCSATLTPDEAYLLVANRGSHSVSVIDTASRRVVANIPVGNRPCSIAVSPDGSRAYVAGTPIAVIDLRALRVIDAIPLEIHSGGIVLSIDGERAYVTSDLTANVYVIDTKSNRWIDTFHVPSSGQGIAISRDGATLYVINRIGGNDNPRGGTVSVVDRATLQVRTNVPVQEAAWRIRTSRDGRFVLVTDLGHDPLTVIDTSTETAVGTVSGCVPQGDVVTDSSARFA